VSPKTIDHNIDPQGQCDWKLAALRDDLATDLFELEDEYYSSTFK
jgi:mediator of RNA polymerase II transcription subunit 22